MTDRFLFGLILISALGCGLVAGVFFAFSNFVMKALARLPAAQGIAAMNSINVTVISPAFMTALFGTAACCAVLVASALRSWHRPEAFYLLGGGLIYFIGNAVVTMAFNVPLKQCSGGRRPADRRWRRGLGEVPQQLDGLEPRTDRNRAHRRGVAHDRAHEVLTDQSVSCP